MSFRNPRYSWRKQVSLPIIPAVTRVEKERRRYDRATREEVERRRVPRLEPSYDVCVKDVNARRLGVVGDLSGTGCRVFPESDEEAKAFVVGKQMELTLVGENSRLNVCAKVVYVTRFAIGLEFV